MERLAEKTVPFFRDYCCKRVSIAVCYPPRMKVSASELQVDSIVSLNQAAAGCILQVESVVGEACRQLRDMGFCEQMRLRKISNGRNLICSICGSRLAISRHLAEQIRVREVN